jgi:hypothetical protein
MERITRGNALVASVRGREGEEKGRKEGRKGGREWIT